jgi:phosphate transport system protein
MSHYEERLDADLTNIRQHVGDLAQRVSNARHNAVEALHRADEVAATETVLGDNPINRDSRQLDRLCHAFIARHLPSAGHLRLMSATVRVNIALERIGDYAVTVARESLQLAVSPDPEIITQLDIIAEKAISLLDDAAVAFCEGDTESAQAVTSSAREIEAGMDDIYGNLFEHDSDIDPRGIVSVFAIFSQLKRVADQAKNICDQTRFAVSGEAKGTKLVRILFVDSDNATVSQLAEALARRMYPNSGEYASAGAEPAADVDLLLLSFLENHGVESSGLKPQSIVAVDSRLADFKVVISLDKEVKEYLPQLPFHTSSLCWQMAAFDPDMSDDKKRERLEEIYRELSVRLEDLMQLLIGPNAG